MSSSTAAKARAEVSEHFDRDVPFAVPLHGVLRCIERLGRVEHLQSVALGQRQTRDGLVHVEDGIDGALVLSREIARHVRHGLQVLVIQARLFLRAHGSGELGNGHRGQWPVPTQAQRSNRLEGAVGARQTDEDRNVLACLRIVQQADDLPGPGHPDHRRDVRG
jgi:hypothetical protein